MVNMRLPSLVRRCFLIVVTFTSILPFILMLVMTTHTTEGIYAGVSFLPGGNFLNNLRTVISADFFTAFRNSVVVSGVVTLCCILVNSMVGYALTAYRFRLRGFFYNCILITMMIPNTIGLVGYMSEMRMLGLSRTLLPLMVQWFASGFGAFWMTQYFRASFELSLVESARIDGCNEMGIFFRIVLPCVKPALITLGLMVFLWSWNSYITPLIMVNNSKNMTIPLFIQGLGNEYRSDYAAQITGLAMGVLPIIVMFALGSKNFIKGLTAGAVKG